AACGRPDAASRPAFSWLPTAHALAEMTPQLKTSVMAVSAMFARRRLVRVRGATASGIASSSAARMPRRSTIDAELVRNCRILMAAQRRPPAKRYSGLRLEKEFISRDRRPRQAHSANREIGSL